MSEKENKIVEIPNKKLTLENIKAISEEKRKYKTEKIKIGEEKYDVTYITNPLNSDLAEFRGLLLKRIQRIVDGEGISIVLNDSKPIVVLNNDTTEENANNIVTLLVMADALAIFSDLDLTEEDDVGGRIATMIMLSDIGAIDTVIKKIPKKVQDNLELISQEMNEHNKEFREKMKSIQEEIEKIEKEVEEHIEEQ